MAFALDADPTSATMNCYATVAEADEYFESQYDPLDDEVDGNTVWAQFSDAKKAALLATATRELDTFVYGGMQVSATQPLQWPRVYISTRDGNSMYPSTPLPPLLKQATFELAYWRWTEADRAFSDTELDQLESYKAGPVDYKARKDAKPFPPKVIDLLKSIGPGTLLGTGASGTGAKSISL